MTDKQNSSNPQQDPPKIEFPCENYPIKVVGEACLGYDAMIIEIVRKHAPELKDAACKANDSRNGRFRSLTLYITATGIPQLQALHQELSQHPNVKMVI